MSYLALNLLIEAGFLLPSGKINNFSKIPHSEITNRLRYYAKARIQTAGSEINKDTSTDSISVLFSRTSSKITRDKILCASLVYKTIVIDDPLISSREQVSVKELRDALNFYSWAFPLIKRGFLKTLPITLLSFQKKEIPLLYSDDAFKSSVPFKIHDFIHRSAQLKSVIHDDKGRIIILREKADLKKRPAIHVSFKEDYWVNGVNLYLYQTMENIETKEDEITATLKWDRNLNLSHDNFSAWKYQVVNQAIRARLINIQSECELANNIGCIYVTESKFESTLLSAATGDLEKHPTIHPAAKFIEANNSFIRIDSPSTIIELRDNYPDAFKRFHYSLLDIADRLIKASPENFDKDARKLFALEIMPQIDHFKDSINAMRANATKGSLTSLGGFALAFATDSTIPLISMIMSNVSSSMTEAFPSISQHQLLKKRPAYIWHRLTKFNS